MDDFDELDDKKQRESNVFREEEETGMPPDGFMNKVQPKPSLVGVTDKLNDGDNNDDFGSDSNFTSERTVFTEIT